MATKRKTTTIQTTEIVWVCGDCKTEWNAKSQAESCCSRKPKEDIIWVCGACKNEWRKESQALSCCGREPECERCGREGHTLRECYARTHLMGESLIRSARSNVVCYTCGAQGHYANQCYGRK